MTAGTAGAAVTGSSATIELAGCAAHFPSGSSGTAEATGTAVTPAAAGPAKATVKRIVPNHRAASTDHKNTEGPPAGWAACTADAAATA
jgi:hypothetical protein